MTTFHRAEIDTLIDAVANDGLAAHDGDVRALIAAACRTDVSAVAIGVLADPRQPEVARLRALARVAAGLLAMSPSAPAGAATVVETAPVAPGRVAVLAPTV